MTVAPPSAEPAKPRSRRWFVVLAWVTLVGGVTGVACGLGPIQKYRENRGK